MQKTVKEILNSAILKICFIPILFLQTIFLFAKKIVQVYIFKVGEWDQSSKASTAELEPTTYIIDVGRHSKKALK